MKSGLIRRILLRKSYLIKNFSEARSKTLVKNYESDEVKSHIPVMVEEVVENLNLKEGNMFLDMTFGAGGHSEALLKRIPRLQVFALDRDPVAIEFAKKLQNKYPGQIKTLEGKFSDLPSLLNNYNVKENSFNGILFDLGCSSMQLDNPERGFSVAKDGPLDMRMDGGKENGLTAAEVIEHISERDLVEIFKTYGGEKLALKISQAIVHARVKFEPLRTTCHLKDLIETVLEKESRSDKLMRKVSTATKAFQALRIFVNNEINELNYGIILAHKYLKPKGRAVVISFHSAEDLIVKRQFKNLLVDNATKPSPLMYINPLKAYCENEIKEFQPINWNVIHKKVISPSKEEVEMNPRSRSANLRVAEKVVSSKQSLYNEILSLDES